MLKWLEFWFSIFHFHFHLWWLFFLFSWFIDFVFSSEDSDRGWSFWCNQLSFFLSFEVLRRWEKQICLLVKLNFPETKKKKKKNLWCELLSGCVATWWDIFVLLTWPQVCFGCCWESWVGKKLGLFLFFGQKKKENLFDKTESSCAAKSQFFLLPVRDKKKRVVFSGKPKKPFFYESCFFFTWDSTIYGTWEIPCPSRLVL